MTINPLGDDNRSLFVVVDDDDQDSLWSAFAGVLAGRRVVCGEADRVACLDYIEQNSHESRSALWEHSNGSC
jgi:uncharacterized protein YbdZ (MbtH family)